MDLRALFKSIELLSRRVSDIEKLASNLHVRLLPPTAWCIVIVQIKDIFAGGGFYTVQKMVGTPNTAGKHATSKTDLHMPEGLTVATGERIDILINLAEDQDTAAHHLHNTDYHLAVRVGQFVKNGNNGSVGMQDVLVTDWMPPTRTLKITDIYGMDSIGGSTGGGRYKAQLVLGTATQVAPDNTTLHLPDHGETLQGTNTYVFENLAENGIGGHALKTDGTCFVTGIFVGLTSDKPPNFIYRGYAAGPSDGGLVAITGSATGGGKYEGVILGPPGADVAATGDLARSDLGVSGEACLVLNTREEGKSTHDLAASGYLPLVFVYAFRRRNSDGKLVVAIDGARVARLRPGFIMIAIRHRSFWDLLRIWLLELFAFAGGGLGKIPRNPTNGKTSRLSDGKVRRMAGTTGFDLGCCRLCPNCPDLTPCSVLGTFAGIALCSDCFPAEGGGFLKWEPGSTFNVSVCLRATPNDVPGDLVLCGYSALITGPKLYAYSDPDCTTNKTLVSATWVARVSVVDVNTWFTSIRDGSGTLIVFQGDQHNDLTGAHPDVSKNCMVAFGQTNCVTDDTQCGESGSCNDNVIGLGGTVVGYGGTFAGTPGGCSP